MVNDQWFDCKAIVIKGVLAVLFMICRESLRVVLRRVSDQSHIVRTNKSPPASIYATTISPDCRMYPQPPIADTARAHALSCSARTPSSRVTPCPFENVIRHLTSTFPPPPVTNPDSWSVWTDVEFGVSVPPSGSMLRISMIESQAAVKVGKSHRSVRVRIYQDRDRQ